MPCPYGSAGNEVPIWIPAFAGVTIEIAGQRFRRNGELKSLQRFSRNDVRMV